MSEEKITSWRVLREGRKNIAWVNDRFVGVVSDEQVFAYEAVCPTPQAQVAQSVGRTAQQGEVMQDKCEKKDCDEPRTCLHYCDKHHQEICLNGHATLQEFLAAQQSSHPTNGGQA